MASAVRDMAEGKPLEGVVKLMNALSYVFLLLIVASAIVWIIWVAYGNQDKPLNAPTGNETLLGDGYQDQIRVTTKIAFQAVVATSLVYFVFRHHFSHMHY